MEAECLKCDVRFEYIPFEKNSTTTGEYAPLPKCPDCNDFRHTSVFKKWQEERKGYVSLKEIVGTRVLIHLKSGYQLVFEKKDDGWQAVESM